MLGKSIGQYYLTLSNEKYSTATGHIYEVTGVDVDVPWTVFPKDTSLTDAEMQSGRLSKSFESQ
jgi:hypothetical protein